MAGPAQPGLSHSGGIDRLIINSPYNEPSSHWRYDRAARSFELVEGRRRAGYLVATPNAQTFDDPGEFHAIALVERIRPQVAAWRRAGWPGVTGVTRRLLEHWSYREGADDLRLFFCQLEAAETLIWLAEGPDSQKAGIDIPSDGGDFVRLCSKMATGTGKTVVMAMVIAWQILNKTAYRSDPRFSRNVLVVAPGLTVRSRLSVLDPNERGNYYGEFDLVPSNLRDRLRQGRVRVRNWHALGWQTEEQIRKRRSVDKRGPKSDEAWVREALGGEMARSRNLLVINDEAHHAWRVPAGRRAGDFYRADLDEATKWVESLDRIHRARGVLHCYDFTATPFVPSGKKASGEALFDWIVSDFSLNDAIESGLVKTPRVVVRDDAGYDPETYKSRLYHIYNDRDVKTDLNRKAPPGAPLPDLAVAGYTLLGHDWAEARRTWEEGGHPTPPVMITVANRTETAARVKHAFDRGRIPVEGLCEPDLTLHIDSKVLKKAEESEAPIAELPGGGGGAGKLTQKQQAEMLRRRVDTIGRPGEPGADIRHVISVAMLSEGWDAKTVTHIMGLRAFSSQLLCEQVVGRGLRRTSYEVNERGFFEPEYVNIFGVPFTFLPHESPSGPPSPPKPKTLIGPLPEKARFEIEFPVVIRVERVYRTDLSLDWEAVEPLVLDPANTPTLAELAKTIEGKTDHTDIRIDLEEFWQGRRLQQLAFQAAAETYDQMAPAWPGNREALCARLAKLTQEFLASDRIAVEGLWNQEPLRRRILIGMNMTRIVGHFWRAVDAANTERLTPVFDPERPIRSTGDMGLWYTGKPVGAARRSHINFCVYDGTFEPEAAAELDVSPDVESWVKNDHLGFEVSYVHRGVVRRYLPDFLIRLRSGAILVLEVKGEPKEEDESKWAYMRDWVEAVNTHGGFGCWAFDVFTPDTDLRALLYEHNSLSSCGRQT